jgi:hypothetical protein
MAKRFYSHPLIDVTFHEIKGLKRDRGSFLGVSKGSQVLTIDI